MKKLLKYSTIIGTAVMLTGSAIAAGSGTLVTLEYTGDGSPCLNAVIVSDPDANGLDDVMVVDCNTIKY